MHVSALEFARNVLGFEEANSMEFDEATPYPIVHLMKGQTKVTELGATMRLGAHPCILKEGSRVREIYGKREIQERYRHRYEFNSEYRKVFEEAGVAITGESPETKCVEVMELIDHPFYIATQYHPEFKSRPTRAHPLFKAFVAACKTHRDK
jgi:CTP synthase